MATLNPQNEINFFYRDSPPRPLVSPVLHGDIDYHTWARNMKQTLIDKNMWYVIDGSPIPSLGEIIPNGLWQRCNARVLSMIQYSTDEPIRQTIMGFDRASEAWENLHERFSQSQMTTIFRLQEQILQAKQGSLTVEQYYEAFTRSWDQMESLRPALLNCHCPTPCICGAAEICKIYRDQDCVLQFLRGLNERFAEFIVQILHSRHLPPLHDVALLALQHEEQSNRGDVSPVSESIVSHADQSNSNRSGIWRSSRFRGRNRSCTHCGKSNHTEESCYRKHGFPTGFNRRNNNNNASSAHADNGPRFQTTAPVTVVGFTDEQYQGLTNLLQQAVQRSETPSLSDFHSPNPVQSSSYHTATDSSQQ